MGLWADACGVKFLFNCANHTLKSLSTYTFPLFYVDWELEKSNVASAWDNKGDIVIGNDVWIGFEAVILAGVKIGDGAIIGTRAVVTNLVIIEKHSRIHEREYQKLYTLNSLSP